MWIATYMDSSKSFWKPTCHTVYFLSNLLNNEATDLVSIGFSHTNRAEAFIAFRKPSICHQKVLILGKLKTNRWDCVKL